MFNLVQSGPVYGDSTSNYTVVLERDYTIFEFIEELLLRVSDWGSVIVVGDELGLIKFVLKYKYGEVKSSNITSDLLSSKVINITCHGGYTRMDYTIKLH